MLQVVWVMMVVIWRYGWDVAGLVGLIARYSRAFDLITGRLHNLPLGINLDIHPAFLDRDKTLIISMS
jgi:hypothetical protein